MSTTAVVSMPAAGLMLLALLASTVAGQEQAPDRTAQLHAILSMDVRTEQDVDEQARRAGRWLEADAASGAEDLLRLIAGYYAAKREPELLIPFARFVAGLDAAGGTADTVPGDFAPFVGRMLTQHGARLTDAAQWQQAAADLPLIVRHNQDPRSAYWLMGRRGRDSQDPGGQAFLQRTVIPAVLADHRLDDADRVYLLRRLYEVEYTGPRPFVHVEGPDLAGQMVSTRAADGEVTLVCYWATW